MNIFEIIVFCLFPKILTLIIMIIVVSFVFSFLLFVQSTPMKLKWAALSLRHCSGNRINASNGKTTVV